MSYYFHPEALTEHKESAKFYETRRIGLGRAYVAEVERAALQASEYPNRFRVISSNNIRKVLVARFPYTVYFRDVHESVQILAIAHHRRKPGYWQNRI